MSNSGIRLPGLVRPHLGGLATVCTLVLADVVFQIAKPWPLKIAIDSVLNDQPLRSTLKWIESLPWTTTDLELLGWLATFCVLIFLGSWLCQLWLAAVQASVGSRLTYELANRTLDHLQRLSLTFHQRHPTGDLVRRVTHDASCLRQFVVGVLVPAMTAVVTLVVMCAIMWAVDASLTLIALIVTLPLVALIRLYLDPMTQRTWEQQQLEGEMMAFAERTLTTIPIVQAFGREPFEESGYRVLSERTLRAYLKALIVQLTFGVWVEGVLALGTAALMLLGGIHVLDGRLTVGELIVFLAYLRMLYAPISELVHLSTGYANSMAGWRRVGMVLSAEGRLPEPARAHMPAVAEPRQRGCVRFENVTFGYVDKQPVLNDVTLEVQAGEMVALVGKTGAGKSSLVGLIPRLFDPWEGRVLIDDVDIRDLKLSTLRSQIAMVLQEPYLLPLSIAATISWGMRNATRSQIEAAAVDAGAHEFIVRLPHQYDTVLGERGATLSVGQRQRLSIARALCRNAGIVILDEPTSSLDSETEAAVMQSLERLSSQRTTFVIAHRLSTIRSADRIVVLEHGLISEVGSVEELMALGKLT